VRRKYAAERWRQRGTGQQFASRRRRDPPDHEET